MQTSSDTAVRMRIGGPCEQFKSKGKAFDRMNDAIDRVRQDYRSTEAAIAKAATDKNLSPQGVTTKARELADGFKNRTRTTAQAPRESVQMHRDSLKAKPSKTDGTGPSPQVASDIRRRIASAKEPELEANKYASDPEVMAAVLDAHPMASGLTRQQHDRLAQSAKTAGDPNTAGEADELDRCEHLFNQAMKTAEIMADEAATKAGKVAKAREEQAQQPRVRKAFPHAS